jgi:hypothetical protein
MVQRDRLLTAIVSRLPMAAAVNFQQLTGQRCADAACRQKYEHVQGVSSRRPRAVATTSRPEPDDSRWLTTDWCIIGTQPGRRQAMSDEVSRRLLLGVKESGGRVAGSLWYRRQGDRGDFEELLARGSARRLHRDALRDRGEIAGQR